MKDLLHYLASSLVDDASCVVVEEKQKNSGGIHLLLTVKKEDLGKVIGKKGRTAKAIRTLLSVVSAKQNQKVLFEIIEPPKDTALPSSPVDG